MSFIACCKARRFEVLGTSDRGGMCCVPWDFCNFWKLLLVLHTCLLAPCLWLKWDVRKLVITLGSGDVEAYQCLPTNNTVLVRHSNCLPNTSSKMFIVPLPAQLKLYKHWVCLLWTVLKWGSGFDISVNLRSCKDFWRCKELAFQAGGTVFWWSGSAPCLFLGKTPQFTWVFAATPALQEVPFCKGIRVLLLFQFCFLHF